MKIISNIELPTLEPRTTRVGLPDEIDQITQPFNHSLLAFLNLSSKTGTSKDDALKAAPRRGSKLEDAKRLPEAPVRLAPESMILPQQTALSNQDLSALQGQVTIPAVAPVPPPFGTVVASPDFLPVIVSRPMSGGTQVSVTGSESIVARLGLFPSVVVQSTPVETGYSMLPVLPTLSGANTRVEVPTEPQSTSENLSHTVPNSASNEFAIPSPIAAMSEGPDGQRSSLPKSDLNTASKVPSSSVQSSAPIATTGGIQDFHPSEALDTSTSGMPDPIAKPSVDSLLDGASSNFSNAGSSAIQTGVSSAADESQNVLPKDLQDAFLGIVRNAYSDAGPTVSRDSVANPAPAEVNNALPQAMPNSHSSLAPSTVQNSLGTPISKTDSSPLLTKLSSTMQSESQNLVSGIAVSRVENSKASLDAVSSPFVNAPSNRIPVVVNDTASNRESNVAQNLIQKARLTAVSPSIPSFPPDELPTTAANVRASAYLDRVLDTLRNDFSIAGQNLITPVVVNAVSSGQLGTNPAPVLAAAAVSVDGEVVTKASPVVADHGIPPSASPVQPTFAADLSVPGTTSDLLVATTQLGGGTLKVGKAGISNLIPASLTKPPVKSAINGKDGSKGVTNDSDLKQRPLSASVKSDFHSDMQEMTQTSDQSRGYTSSQGQSAASEQTNLSDHAVVAVDHTQTTILASPVQSTATIVGSPEQKVMAAGNPNYASTPVQQPLPVINSAKLIQSIGQSEMRVGMRSNEFGNISINTSATHGLISAQISLDHDELARTLAAHLPEIQARLGGNQAVDVRIDRNGIGAGQGLGNPSSMSNGSSDQSRDGRQQPGGTNSSYFGSGFAARQASPIVATAITGDGRLSARLDVRF